MNLVRRRAISQAEQNLQMQVAAKHRDELTRDEGGIIEVNLAALLCLMQDFADSIDGAARRFIPIRVRRVSEATRFGHREHQRSRDQQQIQVANEGERECQRRADAEHP